MEEKTMCSSLAKSWIQELPMYQPGRPLEEVARELQLDDIDSLLKLASNENALGPSPLAIEAMSKMAAQMHLYPDGNAYALKQALAHKLHLSEDQLILGNGSNELIELLARAYLGPESSVVVSDQSFLIYRLVAAAFEASCVMVPMKSFTHDLSGMLGVITDETKLVFISNPNNPTGTMVKPSALDRFMAQIPKNVVVVLDEAYIELVPPSHRPHSLRYLSPERPVYILRTFSKAYGLAGLRIGYAMGSRCGIELLHRIRQPFNVNAMGQAAALAALEDEKHLGQTFDMVKEGQQFLTEGLAAMGLDVVPSVTNFLLIKVGRGKKIVQALLQKGIIVRPMDAYELPAYVRVTIGTQRQNERFLSSLNEVLKEKNL